MKNIILYLVFTAVCIVTCIVFGLGTVYFYHVDDMNTMLCATIALCAMAAPALLID